MKHLIYPVPDPAFPFLGVHFTRMIDGAVECGPNAVLALAREGYSKWDFRPNEFLETLAWPGFRRVARKYWRTGLGEYRRSFSKRAFVRALQRLVPAVTEADLLPAPAGVRAQACDRDGNLLDDFAIRERLQQILRVGIFIDPVGDVRDLVLHRDADGDEPDGLGVGIGVKIGRAHV